MNIIWITTQFPNGTENKNGMFIYRTVRELSKYYSITVIVLHPVIPPLIPMFTNLRYAIKIYKEWKLRFPPKPKKPEGIKNVNIIYSKFLRPPRIKDNFWEGWFAYISIKKKIKKLNTKNDTILHATWLFPEGQAAYILNKKFKIPYVVTLMGSDVNYLDTNTRKYLQAINIFKTASMVTSVSQALFNTCIEKKLPLDNRKISLTHTIYETEKFIILDKIKIRDKLKINQNKKVIFFAGALRKLKNVDILTKSIAKLKKFFPNIMLYIAGNGFEEGNIKKLISEFNLENNVIFLGNLKPDKLIDYYNAADVFCLPSKNEGLPNVIIEALLCGVPVVASKVGEIPFIINEQNKNGFIVEPNSVESLVDKLSQALKKNWDRESLRKSVDFLNKKNVLEEYKNTYQRIFPVK